MHRIRPLAAASFDAHNSSSHLATRPFHHARNSTGDRTNGDAAQYRSSERRKASPFGCIIPAQPRPMAGRGSSHPDVLASGRDRATRHRPPPGCLRHTSRSATMLRQSHRFRASQ